MTKIIALAGKGGVGKTSAAALIVRELRNETGKRILAIDGDPAAGLSYALGVEVKKTLDQIRTEVIASGKNGERSTRADLLARLDYELADAITERRGFAFLSIGRPEGKGCYCKVNEYLKQVVGGLIHGFDYIVIDGEAGVEQVSRRVIERATHLLLVSDASKKGIHVAKTVYNVARAHFSFNKAGLLFNRIKSKTETENAAVGSLPIVGALPESGVIREADIRGDSLLEIPTDDAVLEMRRCVERFIM